MVLDDKKQHTKTKQINMLISVQGKGSGNVKRALKADYN